jgi:putative transposase
MSVKFAAVATPDSWKSRLARRGTRVATGVDADGHRRVLSMQVTSSEDGAGWLAFFRDLIARGLTGVKLVTSDAHAGLTRPQRRITPDTPRQRT